MDYCVEVYCYHNFHGNVKLSAHDPLVYVVDMLTRVLPIIINSHHNSYYHPSAGCCAVSSGQWLGLTTKQRGSSSYC